MPFFCECKLESKNRIKTYDIFFFIYVIYFNYTNCHACSIYSHRALVEKGPSSSFVVDLIDRYNLYDVPTIGFKVMSEAVLKNENMDEV